MDDVEGPAEEASVNKREMEEAKKVDWKALKAEFTWEKPWTS